VRKAHPARTPAAVDSTHDVEAFRIVQAEYVTSAPTIKEAPVWEFLEIAMVGRSNVGKSSLINTLTDRKNLAKTSNTPGKTRLLNFYRINETFSLVDLPGYGYAKVSKTMQAMWQKQFEIFLRKRPNLILVVQLIDGRHGVQPNDRQMFDWLKSHELPTALVITKGDKLSGNEVQKTVSQVVKELQVDRGLVFAVSAKTGMGKPAFLKFLGDYLVSAQALNLDLETPDPAQVPQTEV